MMFRDIRFCVAVLAAAAGLLGGCGAPRAEGGRFAVDAGAYAEAFEAARSSLIDAGYTLERVDAASGVLTTRPRSASLLRKEHTVVRVEFIPADAFGRLPMDTSRSQIDPAQPETDAPDSIRLDAGPVIGQVTAVRERTYAPRLRPQITDARFTGRAGDPLLERRLGDRRITSATARDTEAESRLAGRIAHRLAEQR